MTRRSGRRLALALVLLAGVILGVRLSLAPGDPRLYPAERAEGVGVTVLDHGYHTGLVVRLADLRAAALRIGRRDAEAAERLRWLATRFPDAEWVELGWGDADFYRATPGIADVDLWLGLRALMWPTPSVLHVVPGNGDAAAAFPTSDALSLGLSAEGFDRLAEDLAGTVAPAGPRPPLGPSLYGWGAFYRASPDYHLFRTCNRWISDLLSAAGVPSSPLPGTFSTTLMAELRWRTE